MHPWTITGDPPVPAAQIQPNPLRPWGCAPAALPSEASAPCKGFPKHFILPVTKLVLLQGLPYTLPQSCTCNCTEMSQKCCEPPVKESQGKGGWGLFRVTFW